MHPLDPIDDPVWTIFLACISKVRNHRLKQRLTGIKNAIVDQDAEFATAGGNRAYYQIEPHDLVGTVKGKQLGAVYSRMVKEGGPGRHFYDKIMALPVHELCPMCGHGRVASLDHYLPKSRFPGLAVSPRNLLPACSDCNKAKLDVVPKCESKQTINSYYDRYDNEPWLTAKFKNELPIVVNFSVSPPASWTPMMGRRARHHFKVFKLAKMYASQAAVELSGRKRALARLLASGGAAEVQLDLAQEAESRSEDRKNSWQAALYRALAASKWFCSTGCAG